VYFIYSKLQSDMERAVEIIQAILERPGRIQQIADDNEARLHRQMGLLYPQIEEVVGQNPQINNHVGTAGQ
jgi:hypothetical protein